MAVLARFDLLSVPGRRLAVAFVDWLLEAERQGMVITQGVPADPGSEPD